MKTLHLIRHAKSSWDDPELDDCDRPLNQRGLNDCKIMAPQLLKANCNFNTIFCSIANRAQLTIQNISDHLPDHNLQWTIDERLYTFDDEDLFSWCRQLNDQINDILIIGHNPALTDFANRIGDQFIENVATCAYVQLKLNINSWIDLKTNSGSIHTFLKPKMFK